MRFPAALSRSEFHHAQYQALPLRPDERKPRPKLPAFFPTARNHHGSHALGARRGDKETPMKQLLLIAAAAATIGLAIPAPASAQVAVGVGERGVGVRIGEPGYRERGEYREGWRHRRAYGYGNCRVMRERIVTPRGRVIYRTQRICG